MAEVFNCAKRYIMLPNYEGFVPECPLISLTCIGVGNGYKYTVSYFEAPKASLLKQDYILESKKALCEDDLEDIYIMIMKEAGYICTNDIQLYKYEHNLLVTENDYIYTSHLLDFDTKHDRFIYLINMYEKGTDLLRITDNERIVTIDRLLMSYDLPALCKSLIK
jgi:hypothetical protein